MVCCLLVLFGFILSCFTLELSNSKYMNMVQQNVLQISFFQQWMHNCQELSLCSRYWSCCWYCGRNKGQEIFSFLFSISPMKYYRTDLLVYLNIREEEGLKGRVGEGRRDLMKQDVMVSNLTLLLNTMGRHWRLWNRMGEYDIHYVFYKHSILWENFKEIQVGGRTNSDLYIGD